MGITQAISRLGRVVGTYSHMPLRKRINRVAPALSNRFDEVLSIGSVGGGWTPLSYGEYYPRSALVYSAIKVRQDAIARVPLKVYRRTGFDSHPAIQGFRNQESGARGIGGQDAMEPVSLDHPAQRLLDFPNPFWTRGDLWRATETYIDLWGSAYWGLERDETGQVAEIWPLRSDRMRVVPDAEKYIKGFVYVGQSRQLIPYVPEDIVWIHYFNPLDEYAGLSPIAPLRMSADMGLDALRANRNILTNDSTPGLIIETQDNPTDAEVQEFYERWESRFMGANRIRRPALLSTGMRVNNIGLSPREMEYIQSLRWSLEDVARVYGVPKVMMGDMENTTFSNFQTARRLFWEDTIISQLTFYEEALRQMLLPNFGDHSLEVAFDLSEVEALKESENEKAKRRQMYVSAGILTVNEIRQEMNLPPIEGD